MPNWKGLTPPEHKTQLGNAAAFSTKPTGAIVRLRSLASRREQKMHKNAKFCWNSMQTNETVTVTIFVLNFICGLLARFTMHVHPSNSLILAVCCETELELFQLLRVSGGKLVQIIDVCLLIFLRQSGRAHPILL